MSATLLIQPGLFALAGLACLAARHAALRNRATVAARYWSGLAGLMLVLAVLKLPLVPGAWGEAARAWTVAQGWYEGRRPYQVGALVVLGLLGSGAVAVLGRRASRLRLPVAPVVGAAVLVGHTLIRAASYHDADALLSRAVVGVRLATLIQAVGLLLVAVPAGRAAWAAKRS